MVIKDIMDIKKSFQKVSFEENKLSEFKEMLKMKEVNESDSILETGLSWVVNSISAEKPERIIKINLIMSLIKKEIKNIDYFVYTLIIKNKDYDTFEEFLKFEFFKNELNIYLKKENNIFKIIQNEDLRNKKELIEYLNKNNLLDSIKIKDIPEELKEDLTAYILKNKIKEF
jgi:hypothetical protein